MDNRKYVIARANTGEDIYGMPFIHSELVYLKSVSDGPDRTKGWGKDGLKKDHTPRIHKICISNPKEATSFDESTADFLCAIFNLVASRTDSKHAFFVRSLDSLI